MFDFSSRSYLIWFRLFSCPLKIWSAFFRDTFSSLDDESIMILCCLSWYVSLNCWSSSSYCLLILSHCYWNIFSLLAKESTKSFCCLSIKIFCCLLWYISLNWWSYSSSCLLIWYHCYWNSFSLMTKESINGFFSDFWLYGGSMASCFE